GRTSAPLPRERCCAFFEVLFPRQNALSRTQWPRVRGGRDAEFTASNPQAGASAQHSVVTAGRESRCCRDAVSCEDTGRRRQWPSLPERRIVEGLHAKTAAGDGLQRIAGKALPEPPLRPRECVGRPDRLR